MSDDDAERPLPLNSFLPYPQQTVRRRGPWHPAPHFAPSHHAPEEEEEYVMPARPTPRSARLAAVQRQRQQQQQQSPPPRAKSPRMRSPAAASAAAAEPSPSAPAGAITRLADALAAEQKRSASLQRQVSQMQAELDENASLQTEMDSKEDKLRSLQQQLAEERRRAERAEARVERRDAKLQSFREQLAASAEAQRALGSESAALREQALQLLDGLRTQFMDVLHQWSAHMHALREGAAEKGRDVQRLQSRMDAYEEQLCHTQRSLARTFGEAGQAASKGAPNAASAATFERDMHGRPDVDSVLHTARQQRAAASRHSSSPPSPADAVTSPQNARSPPKSPREAPLPVGATPSVHHPRDPASRPAWNYSALNHPSAQTRSPAEKSPRAAASSDASGGATQPLSMSAAGTKAPVHVSPAQPRSAAASSPSGAVSSPEPAALASARAAREHAEELLAQAEAEALEYAQQQLEREQSRSRALEAEREEERMRQQRQHQQQEQRQQPCSCCCYGRSASNCAAERGRSRQRSCSPPSQRHMHPPLHGAARCSRSRSRSCGRAAPRGRSSSRPRSRSREPVTSLKAPCNMADALAAKQRSARREQQQQQFPLFLSSHTAGFHTHASQQKRTVLGGGGAGSVGRLVSSFPERPCSGIKRHTPRSYVSTHRPASCIAAAAPTDSCGCAARAAIAAPGSSTLSSSLKRPSTAAPCWPQGWTGRGESHPAEPPTPPQRVAIEYDRAAGQASRERHAPAGVPTQLDEEGEWALG